MSTSGTPPSPTKVLKAQLIVAQAKAAKKNAARRSKPKKGRNKTVVEAPGDDGSDKENAGKAGQDTEKKDVIWYVTHGARSTHCGTNFY
jgi:hypothetical protein